MKKVAVCGKSTCRHLFKDHRMGYGMVWGKKSCRLCGCRDYKRMAGIKKRRGV